MQLGNGIDGMIAARRGAAQVAAAPAGGDCTIQAGTLHEQSPLKLDDFQGSISSDMVDVGIL